MKLRTLKHFLFPWTKTKDTMFELANESNTLLYNSRSITSQAELDRLNKRLKDIENEMKRVLADVEYKSTSNKLNCWCWGMWWWVVGINLGEAVFLREQFTTWTAVTFIISCAILIHTCINIIKNYKKREELFLERI